MADSHVRTLSEDFILNPNPIHEGEYGWVFGYQHREFLQTGEISAALAGNAPLLIDKNTTQLHTLGTAHPVEYYVKNYIDFGDPHKVAGSTVELINRGLSVQSIEAIRSVRNHSANGLAAAKSLVEQCISGSRGTVACHSVDDATKLAEELTQIGYVVRRLGD